VNQTRTIVGRRIVAILCSVFFGFVATGPAAGDEQTTGTVYRLSPGDTLRITVYGHEDLSGEFEVDATGRVSLPLIGDIAAANTTVNELEHAVIDALRPDYLKNPRVSVELADYRPFYIFGEVKSPGSYPYSSGMTVISAIAVAGGFTYRARKGRIRIVRDTDDNRVELRATDNTLIRPGDVIEVPERFF